LVGLGAFIILACVGMTVASFQFAAPIAPIDRPAAAFAAALSLCGFTVIGLVPLIRWLDASTGAAWHLPFIIGVGLLMRVIMLPSAPILENDFQRYLWDGAVLANGQNPYALAPDAALALPADTPLGGLAREGAAIIGDINFPQLRTIYPPVAELAFAGVHLVAPFSLMGLRLLFLAAEGATLLLVLALLKDAGRSPLWVSLYWWNPLIVSQLINAAHMEALLLPPLLLALRLGLRRRSGWAGVALALAAGIKLWPVLLLPLLLKVSRTHWWPLATFAVVTAAWAIPYFWLATGEDAGLVAYSLDWQTFGALTLVLQAAADTVAAPHGDAVARVIASGAAVVIAAGLAWRLPPDAPPQRVIAYAGVTAYAVFLLSPAQFPWYGAWFIVFLPFLPGWSMLALNLTLPLYFLAFHLMARDDMDTFENGVVWLAWLPVWLLLAWDLWRLWSGPPTERQAGQR
jgi:alpha-1,6-mannosyltransferase